MSSPQYVLEFIQALQKEIDALKKGKGGSIVKVFNGNFTRESSGFHIYVFHLENFLYAIDDTPAEIEIQGLKYNCQIVTIQGLDVHIGIERNVGYYIPEATIQTNLWFLLEILKKKFEEFQNDNNLFKKGIEVFNGSSNEVVSDFIPEYSPGIEPPNDSQLAAINNSFKKSLSIIWGPPGTGKTKTIAKVVEAHINANRRILLVSHANMAVDEALEDVAEQLKSTIYRTGKLVRLGLIHKKELQDSYPLVLVDNIAAMLGKSLGEEKTALLKEKTKIENYFQTYKSLSFQILERDKAKTEWFSIEKTAIDIERQISNNKTSLRNLEVTLEESTNKLMKANTSGALKRLFLGLDPVRIQKEINQQQNFITEKAREQEELTDILKTSRLNIENIKQKVKTIEDEIERLLDQYGISLEQINKMKTDFEKRMKIIESRLADIGKELEQIQKKVLSEARLVATTLTKTFSSKLFPDTPFDVVIIDEVSMAPLPYIFWALSRVTSQVTLVGDFLQLPPICVSEEEIAQKWLRRSMFDILGVSIVPKAMCDTRISMLKVQYRMAPKISKIPNTLFYVNLLEDHSSTNKNYLNDAFFGDENLVLVDTSAKNPWCSQLSTGGRFNIYSALLSVSIAKEIYQETKESVGIITPYRPQARLINKILKDFGIQEGIRVNVVHSFQGGQESVIIIDCVEGPGGKTWSMLDDKRYGSNSHEARLLLNVALTRAKMKVILVAHQEYMFSKYDKNSIILKVLQEFKAAGNVVKPDPFMDEYFAGDFETYASASLGHTTNPISGGGLYTDKNFWPAFLRDIQNCEKSLIILSPFIAVKRAGKLFDYLRVLVNKGVEVTIYTRPPTEQTGVLGEQSEETIKQLSKIGVKVTQRKNMHQKIALIDNQIVWEGSLNILSHSKTGEQMRRHEGENVANEVIRNLELDQQNARGNILESNCPICGSPLIIRRSRFGPFIGCTRYSRGPEGCKYIEKTIKKKA